MLQAGLEGFEMGRVGAYDIRNWGCKAEHPHDTMLQGSTAEAPVNRRPTQDP